MLFLPLHEGECTCLGHKRAYLDKHKIWPLWFSVLLFFFTSVWVLKFYSKRSLSQDIWLWVRVLTQCMNLRVLSRHPLTHIHCHGGIGLYMCSLWWRTVTPSWRAQPHWGKSLIYICSDNSAVTLQITWPILTSMHTPQTESPGWIFVSFFCRHTHKQMLFNEWFRIFSSSMVTFATVCPLLWKSACAAVTHIWRVFPFPFSAVSGLHPYFLSDFRGMHLFICL